MNSGKVEGIVDLFRRHWGKLPDEVEVLPASGSARLYYRLLSGPLSYIGVYNLNVAENKLFIDFSRHFCQKGLHVPEIYAVADDVLTYLQEDLGKEMLLDVVGRERKDNYLSPSSMHFYRKALDELLRFQILGHEGCHYADCLPRSVFDRTCMLWDLNYFKYCFLRLAGAEFSEDRLETDFMGLTDRLAAVRTDSFMFRDFQSRNIMIRDGEVWFIDYQGGRQGALPYDVASLLYDAIVEIPDNQREELLAYYIQQLKLYRPVDEDTFLKDYYHFVLIRLLQALGAFGLRGLYERKQHFLDSIQPGLRQVDALFDSGRLDGKYPEIRRVITSLRHRPEEKRS